MIIERDMSEYSCPSPAAEAPAEPPPAKPRGSDLPQPAPALQEVPGA